MAFTIHSHSGQFCPGHAKDQLEDIIKYAISIGYETMGLTEHMPRTEISDLYPEEVTNSRRHLTVVGRLTQPDSSCPIRKRLWPS
jgi:histidinol-phosphatase (PHP family)